MDTIIIQDITLRLKPTQDGADSIKNVAFIMQLVLDRRVFDKTEMGYKEADDLVWNIPGIFLVPASSESFTLSAIKCRTNKSMCITGSTEIFTKPVLEGADSEQKMTFRVHIQVEEDNDEPFAELAFSGQLSTSNYSGRVTPLHVTGLVKTLDLVGIISLLEQISVSDSSCINSDLGMLNALYGVVHYLPDDPQHRPNGLGLLANIHLARYDNYLNNSDDDGRRFSMFKIYEHELTRAISMLEDAVSIVASDHHKKPWLLLSLCLGIQRAMLQMTNDAENFAIWTHKLFKYVANVANSESKKPILLNYAGFALYHVYTRSRDAADLDDSIIALDKAVQLSAARKSTKLSYLQDLSESLSSRFELRRNPKDLARSLYAQHGALKFTSDTDPKKPIQLNHLGHETFVRAEEFNDLEMTQTSLTIYEDALRLIGTNHAEKSSILNNLAAALQLRYTQLDTSANPKDLSRIQTALAKAIRISPANDPNKLSYIINHGKFLLFSFARLGDMDSLSRAVSVFLDAKGVACSAPIDNVVQLHDFGLSLLPYKYELAKLNRLQSVISLCEDVVSMIPDGDDRKFTVLRELCAALSRSIIKPARYEDLKKIVAIADDASGLIQENNVEMPSVLNNLGEAYLNCFKSFDDLDDLQKSFIPLEKALTLLSSDAKHPSEPLILNNLGHAYLYRFRRLKSILDMQDAVSKYNNALALIPKDDPRRALWLSDVALARLIRFEELGEADDLDQAIAHFKDSVAGPAPWPRAATKQDVIRNLCCALFYRFHKRLDFNDLDEAIIAVYDVALLNPQESTTRDERQQHEDAFEYLVEYFSKFSGTNDIDAVVLAFENAVQLSPDPDSQGATRVQNLGLFLSIRLSSLGVKGRIQGSTIDTLEKTVKLLPDTHREKPIWLNMVGDLIHRQFDRFHNIRDIGRAITLFEDAVRLSMPFSPSSNHLGLALLHRFRWLGDVDDVNMAVNVLEDAIRSCSDGDLNRYRLLNNLGVALYERYGRHNDLSDLNKAQLIFQVAKQSSPTHSADGAVVDGAVVDKNLASMLGERAELMGDMLEDVDQALDAYVKNVANAQLEGPKDLSQFNTCGASLLRRFRIRGDFDDIEKAIEMFDEALRHVRDDYQTQADALKGLSYALIQRFIRFKSVDDISRCISLLKQALELSPDYHPFRENILFDLGRWLPVRFEVLQDSQDLRDSFSYLASAASLRIGRMMWRFRAASLWAHWVRYFNQGDLMSAYALSMELLPQLPWLGLSMPVRQMQLLEAGQVVVDAVAAAIDHAQYETAIEWLEKGRSVIWSQSNQLRTPIMDLASVHPDLADRLQELSEKLNSPSHSQYDLDPVFFKEKGVRYHNLAQERTQLLEKIRSLEGFGGFLVAPTFSQLISCTFGGPVITVNISRYRCDALVIMPDTTSILHIPLEQFTATDAEELLQSLRDVLKRRSALRGKNGSIKSPFGSRRTINPDNVFENILSKLWVCVVKPILDGIGFKEPLTDNLPRIWWCLTGPMTFLPIHAAGLYCGRGNSLGTKISDFAVSSYTPSLSALVNGVRTRKKSTPRILVVALPEESELPCTKEEIDKIEALTSPQQFYKLVDSDATVENVSEQIKTSSFVHFACHAIQDTDNTLNSALLLAGESSLSLSRISALSLPHAEFAFLSACQTAVGDDLLPEESLHLAAGMISAGYRSVIGTMWSISDSDGPVVAEGVYNHLFRKEGSVPDATEGAYALHLAVQRLRESAPRKPFLAWVPFIHIGA